MGTFWVKIFVYFFPFLTPLTLPNEFVKCYLATLPNKVLLYTIITLVSVFLNVTLNVYKSFGIFLNWLKHIR